MPTQNATAVSPVLEPSAAASYPVAAQALPSPPSVAGLGSSTDKTAAATPGASPRTGGTTYSPGVADGLYVKYGSETP